jgi:hypothetical protein
MRLSVCLLRGVRRRLTLFLSPSSPSRPVKVPTQPVVSTLKSFRDIEAIAPPLTPPAAAKKAHQRSKSDATGNDWSRDCTLSISLASFPHEIDFSSFSFLDFEEIEFFFFFFEKIFGRRKSENYVYQRIFLSI